MADDDPTTKAPRPRRSRRRADPAGDAGLAPDAMPAAGSAAAIEGGDALVAEAVDVHLGAVGRVESGSVSVHQGAIGAARTDTLTVDRGAVGAAMAGQVEVSRGYARSILARQVQLDRAAARVVIAADVRASQTAVMFLVARRVSGDVKVLFDWRGALAFGAVAGAIFAILSRARRRGR